mmetsp:Transcript_36891/g.77424  ORF Transcript_36891/g.77424 Transcript_36891/m.77424 type:complete len:375 (-) Transcript_36891:82-1206(-)
MAAHLGSDLGASRVASRTPSPAPCRPPPLAPGKPVRPHVTGHHQRQKCTPPLSPSGTDADFLTPPLTPAMSFAQVHVPSPFFPRVALTPASPSRTFQVVSLEQDQLTDMEPLQTMAGPPAMALLRRSRSATRSAGMAEPNAAPPRSNHVSMESLPASLRMETAAVVPASRESSRERGRRSWGFPDDRGLFAETFAAFCGAGRASGHGSRGMEAVGFRQLCKHCFLLDEHFTLADADLVFSQVAPEGQHGCIDLQHFDVALGLIAARKGLEVETLRRAVTLSAGPTLQATCAAAGFEVMRSRSPSAQHAGEAPLEEIKARAREALDSALLGMPEAKAGEVKEREDEEQAQIDVQALKEKVQRALTAALLDTEKLC